MTDILSAENPRAITGNNEAPDYAREVTDRMARDYAVFTQSVADMLDKARALPKEVITEADASQMTAVIVDLRDLKDRLEAIRVSEKEPYMRAEQAVDQWFFPLEEKLEKRKKTDKDGAADVLHARVHAYNMRRLAEEKAKREEDERIARAIEEKARIAREKAQREQREAEEKAARARKESNIAEQEKLAREAEERAAIARAEEDAARDIRRIAEAAAIAKPADMTRERHGGGRLNTMAEVAYVEIVDRMQLDFEQLKPFFKDDHVLAALKSWSKTTQHRKPMAGAIIEMRPDTMIK